MGSGITFPWNGSTVLASPNLKDGAIDVIDIEAVFQVVASAGLPAIEGKICVLPFWERGVRYFTIYGPNAEKIEFIQKL